MRRIAEAVSAIARRFQPEEPQGGDEFEKLMDVVEKALAFADFGYGERILDKMLGRFGSLKEEAMKFCEACGGCCKELAGGCAAQLVVKEGGGEVVRCAIYNSKGRRFRGILRADPNWNDWNESEMAEKTRMMLRGRARPWFCEKYTPAHTLFLYLKMERESDGYMLPFGKGMRCLPGMLREVEMRGLLGVGVGEKQAVLARR